MKIIILLLLFCSPASACVVGPYVYYADVIEIYDADTLTSVDIDLGFHTRRMDEKLRLYGIDAPEVRGESKAEGIKARDWLRKRILGKRIIIKTVKSKKKWRGKYGRYLAIVFDQDCVNLNDELVKQGLAVYREY